MVLHLVPRALQYFEQVAQLGSIQAASRELGISASAIHRQITAVEETLGEQLFERESKGMTLTPTGFLLLELARDWRLDSARLWSTLQAEKGLEQGHIRIAAMDGMVNGLIPELVEQIAIDFPRVQVEVKITNPASAVKQVLNGDVDVAVVVNAPPNDNLWFHWTRECPLGCIAAPHHAVAKNKSINLQELTAHSIAFQDATLSIRKLLEANHDWLFENTKSSIEVNSIQLMKQLVTSGRYLALTSEVDAGPEIESGQLKFIPLSDVDIFSQKFALISNLQMPLTSITEKVIARTKAILSRPSLIDK